MELLLQSCVIIYLLSLSTASFPNHDQWIALPPWQQPAAPSYDYYNYEPKNHPPVLGHGIVYDLKPSGYDLKPNGNYPDHNHALLKPQLEPGYDLKPIGGLGYDLKQVVPRDIMVDVINDLGINLLAIHNEHNDNNIALSPYGAISVLAALSEGLRGEAVHEILHAAHLPKDRHVVRVGLRDIHRHLKSYFIPPEGFLAGLTLNLSNVTLRAEYEDVLKFYGFDYGSFNNALYPEPPTTTTLKPSGTTAFLRESTDSISKATQLGSSIGEKATESTTVKETTIEPTTEPKTEATTLNNIETTTKERAETTTNKVETVSEITKTTTPLETSPLPTTSTTTKETTITELPTTTAGKVKESTLPVVTKMSTAKETTTVVTTTTENKELISTEVGTTFRSPKEPPKTTTELAESLETVAPTIVASPTTEAVPTTVAALTTTTLPSTTTTLPLTTEETTVTAELSTTETELTMLRFEATTNDLTNLNAENEFNMLMTTLPPPFFDDSQTTTPFFIGTMPDIPSTTALPPENPPTFDYYNYQDVNGAPLQQPAPNYDEINPGLINNMAAVSPENLPPNVGDQPNQPNNAGVASNLGKRHVRSVGEYAQGGYFEGPHRHESRHYLPDDPKTFSIYGKYREPGINFMKYDTVLPFSYLPNLNSVALSFPLDSSRYYLLLLLPVEENGVDQLICDLRLHGGLKYIVDNLRLTHIVATIPSFMLKGYVSLTPTLQKLGIREVFEPRRADFSPMTDEKNIYVTNIEQAVTVTIKNYMDPSAEHYKNIQQYDPVYFTADHPFLYFVMDSDLNVALMVGKVVNPLNSRIR